MKLREPLATVKALVGENVRKSDRCCGESGTFGISRPDIATQVRFRKEEELRKDETALRATIAASSAGAAAAKGNLKILTSCPSCLQGLQRYKGDLANGFSRPTTSSSRWRTASWATTGCRSTWRRPTTAGSRGYWSSVIRVAASAAASGVP